MQRLALLSVRLFSRLSFLRCLAAIGLVLLSAVTLAKDENADAVLNFTPQIVSLSVNAQAINSGVMILKDTQGNWLIPVDILLKAGIRRPMQDALIIEGDVLYAPVSLFSVKMLKFDDRSQVLDITFDSSAFVANQIQMRSFYQPDPPQNPAGMFINYDLLLTSAEGSLSRSLFTELGGAVGSGILLVNAAAISNENSQRLIRLDTSYTQDVPSDMATWRLGDSITRPATTLGRPVRFGGIQYSTNFHTRPGLVTMPIPTLSGQAALPSTVDLYVNNVLQNSAAVQPGPFSITTAPIVTGDGEVLLRVRDIAGREELISGRFYSSAKLLAPGLSDFSFEAGAIRSNYATPDDHYEKPFFSAAYRKGISDRLTIEGGSSIARGGPAELLAGATMAIPGVGITSLSAGLSRDQTETGLQFAASFERRISHASFSLRSERSDSRYRQLGIDPAFRTRSLDAAFFSYRFENLGSLGLSYTRQERTFGDPVGVIGASFSTRQSKAGSFVLSALQSHGTAKSHSVSIFWIMPIGRDWSSSLSHTTNAQSTHTTIFQAQKSAPYGEGVGWRLQTAINAAQQAAVQLQNPYGSLIAEAATYQGMDSARIGVSGAVAMMGGRWFPTRRITGSYGLVHLPGIPNARIYVDNQFSTRTDSEGYALLPRLHPYASNHVSLEQLDLPLDMRIDQLVARPRPGWRSGVLINFAVKKANAATLRIVDLQGNDIPAGASISLQEATDIFAVGREGIAYIEGLSKETTIDVRWPGRHCRINVQYAASEDLVPYLGEYVCKEVTD